MEKLILEIAGQRSAVSGKAGALAAAVLVLHIGNAAEALAAVEVATLVGVAQRLRPAVWALRQKAQPRR